MAIKFQPEFGRDKHSHCNRKLKCICSWALVAHACNPSYSEGRDQEDRSWKPAQAQQFHKTLS
jgi:hypothetical protein